MPFKDLSQTINRNVGAPLKAALDRINDPAIAAGGVVVGPSADTLDSPVTSREQAGNRTPAPKVAQVEVVSK